MEQLPLPAKQLSATGLIQALLILWIIHNMLLDFEMVVLDSHHEKQRNEALPQPDAARIGLFWCRIGQASDRPGPTHSLFSEAASFSGQRMLSKCAKFLFLTKFLGCTGITLCNTDSCLNAFFSFFLVLWMKSGKTLLWQCFLKNIKQGLLVFFYFFVYILVYFFHFFFSLFFVSVIWPKMLRCGKSFYHFWVIDY